MLDLIKSYKEKNENIISKISQIYMYMYIQKQCVPVLRFINVYQLGFIFCLIHLQKIKEYEQHKILHFYLKVTQVCHYLTMIKYIQCLFPRVFQNVFQTQIQIL